MKKHLLILASVLFLDGFFRPIIPTYAGELKFHYKGINLSNIEVFNDLSKPKKKELLKLIKEVDKAERTFIRLTKKEISKKNYPLL